MQQLDVFLLHRAAIEKALKAREGLFWLFMVISPKIGMTNKDGDKSAMGRCGEGCGADRGDTRDAPVDRTVAQEGRARLRFRNRN